MIDSVMRRLKDVILLPLVKLLDRLNISPGALTLVGGIAGIGAAAAAGFGRWTSALLLWLLNRILDGVDGALARRGGWSSDLGGYLDIMADFIVYGVLPLGIAFGVSGMEFPAASFPAAAEIWPVTAFLLAACYINAASWMYLSALLEKKKAEPTALAMPAGIIEGTETVVFYTLVLMFPRFTVPMFAVFAFLVALTALVRAVGWYRKVKTG
jgi:phosphatidylglycerophosphate synthase